VGLLKSNLITLAGGVSTPTVDPTLALDLEFSSMTALPASITFARASIGTYFDKDGVLQTALSGEARFDHDPSTLEPLGLLIEGLRTNSLLNSAALGTQNVTVTAASWTLSFYGTGSVALSGVYTGTLVSAGAYPARAALTFTPTAGTLTLTPTGSVTNVQLELGSFPTSYIPTTTAAVPRAADAASMTGTNFSSWYSNPQGCTLFTDTTLPVGVTGGDTAAIGGASSEKLLSNSVNVSASGATDAFYTITRYPLGVNSAARRKLVALASQNTQDLVATNGVTRLSTYAANTFADNAIKLTFGVTPYATGYLNGTIAAVKFFNIAKTDAELIELTTP